jgi:hypothetical protein
MWFPASFVYMNNMHGTIIRDTNIFVFVRHVRDICRQMCIVRRREYDWSASSSAQSQNGSIHKGFGVLQSAMKGHPFKNIKRKQKIGWIHCYRCKLRDRPIFLGRVTQMTAFPLAVQFRMHYMRVNIKATGRRCANSGI